MGQKLGQKWMKAFRSPQGIEERAEATGWEMLQQPRQQCHQGYVLPPLPEETPMMNENRQESCCWTADLTPSCYICPYAFFILEVVQPQNALTKTTSRENITEYKWSSQFSPNKIKKGRFAGDILPNMFLFYSSVTITCIVVKSELEGSMKTTYILNGES